MSTLSTMGRALQAGFGLALVAAFALMNGCASAGPAGEPGQLGDESIGEATAANTTGIFRCASRGAMDASLVAKPDATCTQYNTLLPGASEAHCPEGVCSTCRDLSRTIGCLLISTEGVPLDLDPRSRIYSCTLAEGMVSGSLVVKPDNTCTRYPTPLAGASEQYCVGDVCPRCWSLSTDLKCILTP